MDTAFLQGMMFVPGEAQLLLDEFNQTDAVAFSVARKLRSAYTGPAIEVRETGGGTLADIGFDADGLLNEIALLNHVGANDGFVRTWYDHGTRAINLDQTTDADQLQIVDAGTIIKDPNGVPTMDTLVDRFMQTAAAPTISTQPDTVYAVSKIDTLGSGADNVVFDGKGSTNRHMLYARDSTSNWAIFADDVSGTSSNVVAASSRRFGTPRFNEVGVAMTRQARVLIAAAISSGRTHRIQACSAAFDTDAHRWLERLGFEVESTLRQCGKHREDFLMFVLLAKEQGGTMAKGDFLSQGGRQRVPGGGNEFNSFFPRGQGRREEGTIS